MTRRRDVHVIVDRVRRWKVTQGGQTLTHHLTQGTALIAARRVARRHHADVVTHRADGRIRSKDSFDTESRDRDTEH